MASHMEKIISLIKRTGDRCVVVDVEGNPLYVMLSLTEYEKLISGSENLAALNEDEIVVKGDGTPQRSYLYLGDLVTWLVTLLLQGRNGEIYNVGSDDAVSILELAESVRDTLSPGKRIRVLGDTWHSVGNAARNRYVPDISKARTELGLAPWTTLTETIRSTAQHHLSSRSDT